MRLFGAKTYLFSENVEVIARGWATFDPANATVHARMTELEAWRRRSAEMHGESFSARTFDAGGALDQPRCREVLVAVERWGAVHVQRTGLTALAQLEAVLPWLGFDADTRFDAGGRASARTQQKWVAPGLRRLDFYPPDLYLLPNNEVQYRHVSPQRVLFGVLDVPAVGGRVFLHDAREVEALLRSRAPALLARIERHGLRIETGFLSRHDPAQATNYFQSWQERFDTEDAEEALRRARADTTELDVAWWRGDTLMTRITVAARWPDGSLRFPRVALDPPAAHNGYRCFPLGDGTALTPDEEAVLRAVFFDTRQGVPLRRGDVLLFDNQRFGHSRESFQGARELVVAMSSRAPAVERAAPAAMARGDTYRLPAASVDPSRRFVARTLDAGGALTASTLEAIAREFDRHGALHVQHTGLAVDDDGGLPEPVLRALRFGAAEAFPWGGQRSGRTTRRALSPELRATDAYPAHLWLLPHNEVLYQRDLPQRLLFFSARDVPPETGGRTFVHDAAQLEARLLEQPGGADLVASLRRHGQRIEMGFMHAAHPRRAENYFRAWQERFDTDDPQEAEARCRAATHQFDTCWWKDDDGFPTLMTRVTVPLVHDGRLLFPRIALDAPALENGWRSYPRGDGAPFTDAERDLLLHAFLETREGVHWRAGDLLLVDNLRFGHSREAFTGPRTLGVAMAGQCQVRR